VRTLMADKDREPQKKDLKANPDARPIETPQWDELLSKYVQVWIWSLLFGATSGLSYAYIGIRFDRPWGPLAVLPLAIFGVGVIAALGAWWCLLVHLRYSILPTFFGYKRATAPNDETEYAEWAHRRSVVSITKTYQFLLLGGIARLLLAMSDLIFEVLRGSL
jgi:hypothetical protein